MLRVNYGRARTQKTGFGAEPHGNVHGEREKPELARMARRALPFPYGERAVAERD